MGGFLSREKTPSQDEHSSFLPPGDVPSSRKRRRPYSSDLAAPADDAPSVGDAEVLEATTSSPNVVDPTPDGEWHRYIVRNSAIFWFSRKEIEKLLGKISSMPPYFNVQKTRKWDHFFISFSNRACAQLAIQTFAEHKYRNQAWYMEYVAQPHTAKRMRFERNVEINGNGSGGVGSYKGEREEDKSSGACVSAADVTANWRNIPYDVQLNHKRHKLESALRAVTKKVRNELRHQFDVLPWLKTLVLSRTSKGCYPMCCPLEQMVGCDDGVGVREYYRNKNEFTVGMSPAACGLHHDYHEARLCIGYSVGSMREASFAISPVDDACKTTSKLAIRIAQVLTPVVERSGRPAYDKRTHRGYWRQVVVRESMHSGEFLIIITVNPFAGADDDDDKDDGDQDTDARLKQIEADQACQRAIVLALRAEFDDSHPFGVFWQPTKIVSVISADVPMVHLHGLNVLQEQLCGLMFRIQPTAFFQVNTTMAERLYGLIGDIAQVDKRTVVLDICCGTGTIALSLARRAHSVVGIEINEGAVKDARHNAVLNGITNATFVAGPVESCIHEAIKHVQPHLDCVVVLDPPRAGVSTNVITAIRAMAAVRRVVYVACEPKNFWKNAIGLCRPASKAFRLEPFVPVRAYGVDLFPQTHHVEMVVMLERDGGSSQKVITN